MRSRLSLLVLLALSGCAPPLIEIDSSELDRTLGPQPVGLLEVQNVHKGKALGVSVGQTVGESEYCTATLVDGGDIATSADCLRDENGAYRPEDMIFHIRFPEGTKHFNVAQIRAVDAKRQTAYLSLQTIPEFPVARSISLQAKWEPEADDLPTKPKVVEAVAISVPSPNKRGHTSIRVSPVQIAVAPARRLEKEDEKAPAVVAKTKEELEAERLFASEPPPVATHEEPATVSQPVPPADEEPLRHPLSYPRPVKVSGLKNGARGAPLLVGNRMVGIVRGGATAQWTVGE